MVRIPRSVRPDTQQARFRTAVGYVDLNQLLRIVEGGCRFGEIDAMFRDVRFFLSRCPIQISPVLHTTKIWDNVNIELQYNFVGHRHSPLPLFSASTIQFAAGRIGRGSGN